MTSFVCAHLHQPDGWLSPGTIIVDDTGFIEAVRPGDAPDPDDVVVRVDGYALAGLANVHSHAFHRALAGFAHIASTEQDSFWTWRTRMYRLALALQPEDLFAIGAQAYLEMLEAGYTAVGEFQYVHHQFDGQPYDDVGLMSRMLVEAAVGVGLPMTLLPVAYLSGSFDRRPQPHQRRFVFPDADAFLDAWSTLRAARLDAIVGLAPHSLRAVPPHALTAIVDATRAADPGAPIHMHIAEQPQEVQDCLQHRGARPIAWLLDHQAVDRRWCLVHATHADPAEVEGMRRAEAIVGLCPTTEADLGDGLFDAVPYFSAGGRWGIGSDAHVAISPARELALLEWGQRLQRGQRNLLARPEHRVGRSLYESAALDGAAALAQPAGALVPDRRADIVVLDPDHPRLLGHGPDTVLDAWIFAAADDAVRDVFIAGQPVVVDGQHPQRDVVRTQFAAVMNRLAAAMT